MSGLLSGLRKRCLGARFAAAGYVGLRLVLFATIVAACLPIAARAATPPEVVTVYAAGSLRGVVKELAAQVATQYSIHIEPTFGGSGALRERIEHGAHADLLLSADLGSPKKLAAGGRTTVPALPFARNRICIVAPRTAGVTADNLVAKLLDPHTRTWTSEPVVDPGGDYAAEVFRDINARHPGAGATLTARAQAVRTATANAPGAGLAKFAGLFARHKIDVLVTYCSGAGPLKQQAPELASFPVPAWLDPHPVYGMAVLSGRSAVQRVALYLLSPAGQSIVSHNGLLPIAKP